MRSTTAFLGRCVWNLELGHYFFVFKEKPMNENYNTTECYYTSCDCHCRDEPFGYCDGNCELHNNNLEGDKEACEKRWVMTLEGLKPIE